MLPVEGGEFLDWRTVVVVILAVICFVLSFMIVYRAFQSHESRAPAEVVQVQSRLWRASGFFAQGLSSDTVE